MRKFRLLSSIGAEFDLMRTDAFFHSPSGLGSSRSLTMQRVGDYAIPTDNRLELPDISGEMVFAGYAQFDEFADFITPVMTLAYSAEGGESWLYCDCCARQIEKTEIERNSGRLICPIIFTPFTPWYKQTAVYFTTAEEGSNVDDGKIYDASTYPYRYNDINRGTLTIRNDGKEYAPLRITIYGPCLNPSWTLSQNGITLGTGAVTAEIEAGGRLVIDANVRTMEIACYWSSGRRVDYYQHSDFSTARFLYAPPGESSLSFVNNADGILTAVVEVREIASSL